MRSTLTQIEDSCTNQDASKKRGLPKPQTVTEAVERARCRRCGQSHVKDYRLVYHGDGSARGAMNGADVNKGREAAERVE